MELETLEVLLDVNLDKMQENIDRIMPNLEKMMGRIEQITGNSMSKTEKNFNFEEGSKQFAKQLEKTQKFYEKMMEKMEKTSETSSKNIGDGISSGIKKARPKVNKEVDMLINDINAKMGQAKAHQEKLAFLKAQRQDASQKGDSGKVVKYDEQIARTQAQMVRFSDSAKGIAASVKQEFDAIPESLKSIDARMDINAEKMKVYREKIKQLQATYKEQLTPKGDFEKGFELVDTKKSLKTKSEIDKQTLKMKDLVNQNINLETQYSKTEARAESLRKALERINTALSQSAVQTGSAVEGTTMTGKGMAQSERAIKNRGGIFSRVSNSISHGWGSIGNNLKSSMGFIGKFGGLFALTSNRVSRSSRRMSNDLGRFNNRLGQMVKQVFIFGLIYKGLQAVSKGMLSALKTNNQFNASLNQIKVNLMTAFYPIYTAILPAINTLMKSLAVVTGYVAHFISMIFGTTYSAAKQGAQGLYDNVQAMNETGSAAEANKKKIEKLQRSLMGFDEINRIGLDDSSDDESLDNNNNNSGIDFSVPDAAAPSWLDKAKVLFQDFFKPFQEAWAKHGQKVMDAWKYASGEMIELGKEIGKSFMKVWTNGTGERFIGNLLKLLASVLNIVGDIAKAFKDAWNDNGRGAALIQSYFDKLNALLELLDAIAISFSDAWNSGVGEQIAANLYEIYTNINNTIANIATNFKEAWQEGRVGESIFTTLLGIVNDFLTAINEITQATADWAKELDFSPVLKSIDNLLKSIRPLVKNVWDGLAWAWKNILLPLAGFTITELIPRFFDLLAAALDVLTAVIESLKPLGKWLWDNFLQPLASWTGGAISFVLKGITNDLKAIGDWIKSHQKVVEVFAVIVGAFATAWGLVSTAMGIWNIVAGIATVVTGVLGAAIAIITSPVTLVILAIGALIAIGVLLWKNWDEIREWSAKAWNAIKDTVSRATDATRKWVSDKWENIKKKTGDTWNNLKTTTSNTWSNIRQSVQDASENTRKWISDKWDGIKKKTGETWGDMITSTSTTWGNVKDTVKDSAETARDKASNAWEVLKNNVTDFSKNIKDTTKDAFDNVVNWATGLGGRIADGLKSGINAIANVTKEIGNAIVSVPGNAINGVIKGIKWVLNAVNAKSAANALGEYAVPKYAQGTGNHPGGLALVNDGVGQWRESYRLPNGEVGLFPNQKNLLVDLPKGSQVATGAQTAQMNIPAYAGGIGSWFSEKWNQAKEMAGTVWDYVKKPTELLNIGISKNVNLSSAVDPALSIAQGSVATAASGAVDYVKQKISDAYEKHLAEQQAVAGAGAYAPNFPNPPFVMTSGYGPRGLFGGQFHKGIDFGAPLGTPIPANNSGTVAAAGGGIAGFGKWVVVKVANDLHAIYGHVNKWLVEVGQSVSKGQTIATVGNEGQSTGPHLHYELRKGGTGGQAVDPHSYGASQTVSPGAGGATGNAKFWANFAKSRGYSRAAAAGVLGNIQGEVGPGLNPDTAQVGGPAYGLVQWDGSAYPLVGPRTWNGRQYVQSLMGAAGIKESYQSMLAQSKLIDWSMYNGQWIGQAAPTSVSGFKQVQEAGQAAYAFERNFERPASAHSERQQWAREWYNRLSGYEHGGIVNKEGVYRLAEGNKAEMVIPLTQPDRAMHLIEQAYDFMGIGPDFSELQMPEMIRNESIRFSGNSEFQQPTYQGGSLNSMTDSIVSALMSAIEMLGATSKQATNGDIIVNIGGREFGRIAVSEINKYHAQIGRTELNL